MTEPLSQVASNSILGTLLALALIAIGYLYREHKAERADLLRAMAEERALLLKEVSDADDARISDAKDSTALLLKIQQATTDAIGKFYDLVKARDAR